MKFQSTLAIGGVFLFALTGPALLETLKTEFGKVEAAAPASPIRTEQHCLET